ncbi:MAG: LysM peptidoglycan-binding domain-containing protein, partial [Candidatus Binatia bacterium]
APAAETPNAAVPTPALGSSAAVAAGQPSHEDSVEVLPRRVEDSIRHARLAARTTAARLYDRQYDASIEEIAHRALGEGTVASSEAASESRGGASARMEGLARAEFDVPSAALKRVAPTALEADRDDSLRGAPQVAVLEADSGATLQPSSRGVIAGDPFADEDEVEVRVDEGADGGNQDLAPQPDATPSPEPGLREAEAAAVPGGDAAEAEQPDAEVRVARLLGPVAGGLPLGKSVRILPGDTVWDIAVAHYGSAGPITLEAILENNPGIRDPRRLAVGAHIFLPFLTAEQMVGVDRDGSYRVLLTAAPRLDSLDAIRSWVGKVARGVELGTSTVRGTETVYRLFAIGLDSREAALNLAAQLLGEYSRASIRGRGTV